jgi:protocatechuate 3,4-dioxygenase beta subunit
MILQEAMMKKTVLLMAFVMLYVVAAMAQQKTGTLKGRIEDEKGKPLADVEVRVMSSRSRNVKETTTDKEGNYTFELEPDSYTLTFDAEGYKGGTMTDMQQIEEGKENKVKTIKLFKGKRTSLVRGAVFDVNGYSLPGVRIKLVRVANEEQLKDKKKIDSLKMDYITNSRGEFAFRLPPVRARYQVTAMLRGFKPQVKNIDVGEDEAVPLAFSLEPIIE